MKSIPRFIIYDSCMTFVLHFYAIHDENTSTAHDGHFPDPYKFRLSYQTHHFEIVSFLHTEGSISISFTTGILPE